MNRNMQQSWNRLGGIAFWPGLKRQRLGGHRWRMSTRRTIRLVVNLAVSTCWLGTDTAQACFATVLWSFGWGRWGCRIRQSCNSPFFWIDLHREVAPDATTLLKFRHLMEEHHLTESIFTAINGHSVERGLFLREGTIVDATLIAARLLQPGIRKKSAIPGCIKPGKVIRGISAWRCTLEVMRSQGLFTPPIGTASNVQDVTQAQALLHGDETDVIGDAGYQDVEKCEENLALPVTWHIAMRPSML